jgi:hypothetical protein
MTVSDPYAHGYQNEIIAVFGHRGSGKTTWMMKEIESFRPFLLVDPLYDPKFKSLDLHVLTDLDESFELFRNGNPQRCYIAPNLATFELFCGLCLAKGNITMVIDEVDQFSTSNYMTPRFKQVVKMGRHVGVNLIAACRRPHEMNPLIRSQANRFIIFPMGGEDCKNLCSYIPNAMDLVMTLKTTDGSTEYIDYDFRKKIAEKKVQSLKIILDTSVSN